MGEEWREVRTRALRVYVANVGGFTMTEGRKGAEVERGETVFGRMPKAGGSVRRVLELMREKDGSQRRLYGVFVFTETGFADTPAGKRDLRTVQTMFEKAGYKSRATTQAHAGVMIAWDAEQVRAVSVGKDGRLTRVKEKGRQMKMQFTAGYGGAEGGFRVIGLYMPQSKHKAAVVRKSWGRLLDFVGEERRQGGRYWIGGDLNAETEEALQHRMGEGARRQTTDECLRELHEMAGLERMGDLEPTYYASAGARTVIDGVYASTEMAGSIHNYRITEGVDTNKNYHRAMAWEVHDREWTPPEGAEFKPTPMPICEGGKVERDACIGRYNWYLPTDYVQALQRKRRESGLSETHTLNTGWRGGPRYAKQRRGSMRRTGWRRGKREWRKPC